MSKKIEWTAAAIKDRFKIYKFWLEHNKSDTYSEKLEALFKEAANIIAEFPEIGIQTDYPNLRLKVISNYQLFYIHSVKTIQILRVWDTRQNPKKLKL
ncbi:type II toxin-antitoxin system RelE/ParE family toxin [Pedobacter cryophilus]|uniref:Type II toxin-antitoxin system RelE/ParE family toxin n=1 Tax=Pedobacter cryophilus TaxID=2571271 RepID=A0A4U1BWH5_9SPHI|nr:type II toxin-antitoxin system RelE/ParE family toxin [Pedobacter cryophilus]TKB96958.1 type II toxin-antitoxin system RelE/ParE family toxin [Pedobacter cryophilus]